MTPTDCMDTKCIHLILGGKGRGIGNTHYYLCFKNKKHCSILCEYKDFNIDNIEDNFWKGKDK